MLSRLPIRLRLTLAFALTTAGVLAATGAFVYFKVGSSLDKAINDGLRARGAELAAQISRADTGLREAGRRFEDEDEQEVDSFAQVLDVEGRVVDGTPELRGRPVLTVDEIAPAAGGPVWLEKGDLPGVEGPARLLAVSARARGRDLVAVVGASLEDRNETRGELLAALALVGPAALALVWLLGYGVATAALRPVEAMRRRAGGITSERAGQRLPLPRARDEIQRLGQTLNAMLERLEAGLARERRFVADASHELRTPLALLQTELELALRRPRSHEELAAALRSAAQEVERLSRLAEDLLVLARIEEGRLPLRRAPVSAGDIVRRVAERFTRRADEAGRTIELDASDGLEVSADSLRLEQALGNLVENALRHGRGTVRLSAVSRDGRVEFHVLDEGAGFPADFLGRAFQRFTRSDEARSGGGAGLGLAIAQVIANAHGGSAHAVNRGGGGADVWLSLPRR